jgi:hypothetical protein
MTKIARIAAVALLLAFAAACSDSSPTSPDDPNGPVNAQLGQPFQVPVSGAATIRPTGVTVTFLAVPADGRCPTGVNCFWEGEALLDLRLRRGGTQTEVQLTTLGSAPGNVARFDGITLRVVDLLPHPQNESGPERLYRATLIAEAAN